MEATERYHGCEISATAFELVDQGGWGVAVVISRPVQGAEIDSLFHPSDVFATDKHAIDGGLRLGRNAIDNNL